MSVATLVPFPPGGAERSLTLDSMGVSFGHILFGSKVCSALGVPNFLTIGSCRGERSCEERNAIAQSPRHLLRCFLIANGLSPDDVAMLPLFGTRV